MKKPIKKVILILLATGLSGITISTLLRCSIDHGLVPIYSKIEGNISFTGDSVPPHSDEIRIAVAEKFPPRHINQLLFSDMIPFEENGVILTDPVDWEIYVPAGTYEIIAVIWKENNASWNISNIIGIYGGSFIGDLLIPTTIPVRVPNNNSVVSNIDIHANLNRVNRDSQITGTITFQGEWPQNTGIIGIGAFVEIPEKDNFTDYYFKNIALDYNIPTFVQSHAYTLRVRSSDMIGYLAVLWIDNTFDLTSIRDIGFYSDPVNPDIPGTIDVSHDNLTGIDIVVNFSELR